MPRLILTLHTGSSTDGQILGTPPSWNVKDKSKSSSASLKAFSPGTVDLRVSSANSESCRETSLTYCIEHSIISKYLYSVFVSETDTHPIKK